MYIFHIHNIFQYQWYKQLIIHKVYKFNLFHPSFFNLKLKLIFRSLLQIKTHAKIVPPQKKTQLDDGVSACICKGCWGCCKVAMLQMCDFIILKASLDWFIPDPLKTLGSPNIFIAPHLIVYHGAVGSASLHIKTSKHLVAEILST